MIRLLIKKYRPNSLKQKEWEDDLADVVVETAYHSDELSETDIELARQERSKKNRSYNDDDNNKRRNNNHVIKVYVPPWRSERVI
jgi:hypothetical protein